MTSENKVVLITGANTGLGYETLKALYASPTPYTLLLGTRDLTKGTSAIQRLQTEVPASASTVHPLQLDVTSDASLEAAIATITTTHGARLDALIHNAGAAFNDNDPSKLSLREAWNAAWDTNVTGAHVLTTLAVPLLLAAPSKSARLVFVTSGASSLWETEEENWGNFVHLPRLNGSPPAGWPKATPLPVSSYRASKTGLNMMMRGWVQTLRNDGVKVWAVSPGLLATGLGGLGREKLLQMGALEPSVGGEFLRDVVEGKHDDRAGKAIRVDQTQPW